MNLWIHWSRCLKMFKPLTSIFFTLLLVKRKKKLLLRLTRSSIIVQSQFPERALVWEIGERCWMSFLLRLPHWTIWLKKNEKINRIDEKGEVRIWRDVFQIVLYHTVKSLLEYPCQRWAVKLLKNSTEHEGVENT